jgi:phosphoglucosamine mutase
MGRYFGTDGFRGEANDGLKAIDAFKVGRYLGWYYGRTHKARVVIGKDTRRSSYMLEYALVAGLTSSGADAFLMHVTTTPSISYIVRREKMDCGIMISASHNPFYDNGIKVINGQGYKLEAEVENNIEDYIDGNIGELPYAMRENIGRTVDYQKGRMDYIEYLKGKGPALNGMKIGLDLANGSSTAVAREVYESLGADIFVINDRPDGTNINNKCGSTHIEGLCEFVRHNHLDCGFAYDGDADRCLAVNENGEAVTGYAIMYICGCYMKNKGILKNDTVVTTVMSNFGLYKAFDKASIKYEKTDVGDKYVYDNMMKNGHCLGGEDSGHIIFSDHAVTGDGILTSLELCHVMKDTGKKLCELSKDFKIFPQLLVNVKVDDKDAAMKDGAVMAAGSEVEKMLGDSGRILLRKSGTEPLVRVMVEAGDSDTCRKMVQKVVDAIKSSGHAV